MATAQVTYQTISTKIHETEEGQLATSNNLSYRMQDLEDYGRRGYTLVSTVTANTFDGTLIIDTLARAEID